MTANWPSMLAEKILEAQDGDTIIVANKTQVDLCQRAANRLGKKLNFRIAERDKE